MEADREVLCGSKGRHQVERSAWRGGSADSQVTLGGRQVEVPRLRVRSAGGEVPLVSFAAPARRRRGRASGDAPAGGAGSQVWRRCRTTPWMWRRRLVESPGRATAATQACVSTSDDAVRRVGPFTVA